MLHLSTIRQHYDRGFKSVVSLVEELEQQIEALTLASQSPNHFHHLEQTIKTQQTEILRLSETVENKSKEIFKLHQSRLDFQHTFELRLSKTRQLNKQLRTRVRELEYLLASGHHSTPKLDSHNSNLPPSLDPPWNKTQRTRSLRTKTGSQVGGQLGHRGITLLQVDNPDVVIIHPVNICSHCHNSLVPVESKSFQKRQIFEIENGRLTVTEHRIQIKNCWVCRKSTKGLFPSHLKAPVQYGTSVFSRIVYLNQYQLLPVARTAESMKDLFACPVSLSTIQRAAKVCSHKLIRFEYRLKVALRQSQVMGVDESGININGENNWAHVARTGKLTHLAPHTNRGGTAIEEIGIINEFTGTLVRDGFTAYQKYEQCRHSLCNAQLLRDLTFIGEAEPVHEKWTTDLAHLLIEIKDAVAVARSQLKTALEITLQSSFSSRYDTIITDGEQSIRGSPEVKSKPLSAGSLHRRLVKNKDLILRFMTDFSVPFDNNGSERDLRMLKLQQKISGCFRTTEGATVFCRIRSYLSSVRKQGRGLLNALEQALKGKPVRLTG